MIFFAVCYVNINICHRVRKNAEFRIPVRKFSRHPRAPFAHVTGVKLGRRSLKFMDYGIMAATFVNLETGKAFRVVSTEEARDLARYFAPEISGKHAQQLEAYKRMPDNVLFRVQQVNVSINEYDMPGPTRRKAICVQCGQVVRDHREVLKDGRPYCQPCLEGAYFSDAREVIRPDMNWAPEQSERSLYMDHLNLKQSNKVEGIPRIKKLYDINQVRGTIFIR